jgi:two-component system cell cycle sensor histidine kinase/response regulator CckA
MPGMSGIELCRRVASVRPSIRMLCMSGYTERVMSGGELAAVGAAFIEKPFSSAALTSKIRELLAAA